MRQAFMLLGLMTAIVSIGAFVAFERVEAPTIPADTPQPMSLSLTSPAFKEGESIPPKFTCDGDNVNPELHISGIPEGARSLVLVMDDPDIPDSVKEKFGITKYDHWTIYNIPVDTTVIAEGVNIGTAGQNSSGTFAYVGPCPPDREHRYIFRLYAVSGTLNFIKAPTLDEVETAAKGMMLGTATLTGRYERMQR